LTSRDITSIYEEHK